MRAPPHTPRHAAPHTMLAMAALLAGAGLADAPAALAKTASTKEPADPIAALHKSAAASSRGGEAHAAAPARTDAPAPPPRAPTGGDDDDDASPQREAVHVVKAGETLGGVANRAHVPRVLIIEANGLKEPYALREGDRLRLPRTRHHTVAKGESGFDIAYHYGVPFSAIATANGLDPDAEVEPGQKLLIPTITPAAKGDARLAKAAPAASAKPTSGAKASASDSANSGAGSRTVKLDPDARFAWPATGTVVRRFAARGTPNYHDGIDIAGASGTPVRASAGGDVVFAGQEPESFGRLVLIDHKNGWQTAYGFLGKITVAQGDHVRAGERIGLVGHSGKARRDELHFELRKANRPVDPLPQLPASPGKALVARGATE